METTAKDDADFRTKRTWSLRNPNNVLPQPGEKSCARPVRHRGWLSTLRLRALTQATSAWGRWGWLGWRSRVGGGPGGPRGPAARAAAPRGGGLRTSDRKTAHRARIPSAHCSKPQQDSADDPGVCVYQVASPQRAADAEAHLPSVLGFKVPLKAIS